MSLDPGKGPARRVKAARPKASRKGRGRVSQLPDPVLLPLVLFSMFVLNQEIILREEGINFTMQGFALINALVFAKVMMIYEMFDPGVGRAKAPDLSDPCSRRRS